MPTGQFSSASSWLGACIRSGPHFSKPVRVPFGTYRVVCNAYEISLVPVEVGVDGTEEAKVGGAGGVAQHEGVHLEMILEEPKDPLAGGLPGRHSVPSHPQRPHRPNDAKLTVQGGSN